MELHEFTFPSADGKTSIHATQWLPEGEPKAVLQISHGISEYILRYAPFARFLTDRGFAVVGHDHLGHGGSQIPGCPPVYFGPKGSWNKVVDDLYTRRELAGKCFPGLPYFLMGHSMGSFLARSYLIRYPGTVDGAVIMGTGQMPGAMVRAGQAVAAEEALRIGEKGCSPLVEKLAFGSYNKRFAPNRTAFDWVSLREENVDRYLADPLCGGQATVGIFRELLWGLHFIAQPENLKRMNLNTPVFFVSGAEDPVGDMGKGVTRAYRSFQKAGVRQVSLKLYPSLRHEILNEYCGAAVAEDIAHWLEGLLPPTDSPS